MFTAVFKVRPTPKGRPRFTRQGRPYTDPKTRQATKELATLMRAEFDGNHFTCPLAVRVEFQLKRGKSVKRACPSVGADIDNYLKLVLDAANGILWKDDCQICRLTGEKVYGAEDKITLGIEEFVPGLDWVWSNP